MSEEMKCPVCGASMQETYLGYVCNNTSLEDPCCFCIAKHRLSHICTAVELTRKYIAYEKYHTDDADCKLFAAESAVLNVWQEE